LATVLLPVDQASASDKSLVRLGYAGFLGPAQVIVASVGLEMPPGTRKSGSYRMALDVAMSGALAKAVPFSMTAESLGQAGEAGVQPSRFHSLTRIYEKTQTTSLTYGDGGAVEISSDPPTVQAREAREQGLAAGTLDPLSAVVALVDEVVRTGECRGRVQVFDGARRYDLEASPAGTSRVEKIGFSLYEGPATECAVKPILLNGFRQRDVDAGFYPQSARMWIAPVVAGEPPVPVRVMAQSGLGTMRLDLVEAWAMDGTCLGETASC
jgi:hypothetical protein